MESSSGTLAILYPFRATCGINVDVRDFSPVQFYQLYESADLDETSVAMSGMQ